jgi:hypothetical protein
LLDLEKHLAKHFPICLWNFKAGFRLIVERKFFDKRKTQIGIGFLTITEKAVWLTEKEVWREGASYSTDVGNFWEGNWWTLYWIRH